MICLCDMCAFKQSDCKGNKDLEKVHCPYYKKPDVFNAKEASERIAELERELNKIVRCKDCCHIFDGDCPITWGKTDDDFCSYGERR